MTYELDGEQYVLALAGQGGAIPLTMGLTSGNYPRQRNGRLMAFKLNGDASLPVHQQESLIPLDLEGISSEGNPLMGGAMYGAYCSVCHGPVALSAGPIPDLRYSPMILSEDGFAAIVLEGALQEQGMPAFAADIGATQVESIRAYLLQRAASVSE